MKKILTIVCWMCLSWAAQAQDIHFSQFYMAPLIQNPAMAGAMSVMEATANYRSQWKSITIPYKSYAASMHMRLMKRRAKNYFGIGLNMVYDQSGDGQLSTTIANFSVAYHVRLSQYQHLGLGVQGGFGQRRIDMQQFQWGSQYDNTMGFNPALSSGENYGNPAFVYGDFSSGLVWAFDNNSGRVKVQGNNFSKGHIGLSVFHFNNPGYSFNDTGEKLQLKYVLHSNFLWSLPGTRVAVNPGLMAYKQGPNREVLLGGMVRYDLLAESKYSNVFENVGASVGAYYRWKDAIIVSAMLEMSTFAIGLSYDANLSTLRPATNGRGGFEISLRYTGDSGKFAKSIRTR